MSTFQKRLTEAYLFHYRAINDNPAGVILTPKLCRELDLMLGDFLSKLPQGAKILDLGCGTGATVQWLDKKKGINAVGVDSSESQIKTGKVVCPESTLICSDGLNYLAKNSEVYDAIICTDVVEHLPTLDVTIEFLEAVFKSLRPNGWFFCRVPNAANFLAAHSLFSDLTHHRLYTAHTLSQIILLSGFEESTLAQIRAPGLLGKFRLLVEHFLHTLVFAICGRRFEKVFTRNVCVVGYKKSKET